MTLTPICSYVFGEFQTSLQGNATKKPWSRTIPTSLTLYIFGFLYQLVLVYDALRLKNTIQVIGLCLYNVGLLVYAAVQMIQIRDAVDKLRMDNDIEPDFYPSMKPYLIAPPCVIGLGTFLMSAVAWKLYDEFAWTIYKHISADLRMKRRYLTFQVSVTTAGNVERGKAVANLHVRSISLSSNLTFSSSLDLPFNFLLSLSTKGTRNFILR